MSIGLLIHGQWCRVDCRVPPGFFFCLRLWMRLGSRSSFTGSVSVVLIAVVPWDFLVFGAGCGRITMPPRIRNQITNPRNKPTQLFCRPLSKNVNESGWLPSFFSTFTVTFFHRDVVLRELGQGRTTERQCDYYLSIVAHVCYFLSGWSVMTIRNREQLWMSKHKYVSEAGWHEDRCLK